MPVDSQYPLNRLLELRQANVRQLEVQLANDLHGVNAAAERVLACEQRRASAERALAAEEMQRVTRALQGAMLADDFAQGAAHAAGLRAELERTQRAESAAGAELEALRARMRETGRQLESARRKLANVERHQQKYADRIVKKQEMRTEEDAAEVWQAQKIARKPEES